MRTRQPRFARDIEHLSRARESEAPVQQKPRKATGGHGRSREVAQGHGEVTVHSAATRGYETPESPRRREAHSMADPRRRGVGLRESARFGQPCRGAAGPDRRHPLSLPAGLHPSPTRVGSAARECGLASRARRPAASDPRPVVPISGVRFRARGRAVRPVWILRACNRLRLHGGALAGRAVVPVQHHDGYRCVADMGSQHPSADCGVCGPDRRRTSGPAF